MVATTLTRIFGHNSNSFSDSEQWPYRGYRLFGTYLLALIMIGIVTLIAGTLMIIISNSSMAATNLQTAQIRSIDMLNHKILYSQLQIDSYLITRQSADLAASDQALTEVQSNLDQWLGTIEPKSAVSRVDLQALQASVAAYTNIFHSLSKLIVAGAAPDIQQMLSTALKTSGEQLDRQADKILEQTAAMLQDSGLASQSQNQQMQALLLVVILFSFGLGATIMVRRTHFIAKDLDRLGQAAHSIGSGHFETRVALLRHDELGRLGAAFNAMAENLSSSVQTETAANNQNWQQMLKLARQERLTSILEERQRIARELHDSVKQQLFSIVLSAGAALNYLIESPDLARTYVEHVQQAGQYAQAEMTSLVQELIPFPLQDQRLEDALDQYLHLLCDTHQIHLLWRVEGTNTLTIAQEHALFRTVQESVANVVRHSKATFLRVAVYFGLQTQVIIEDNGQGFDPKRIPSESTGLATMKLRLNRVGGSYKLTSAPGSGTRLIITLDLRRGHFL